MKRRIENIDAHLHHIGQELAEVAHMTKENMRYIDILLEKTGDALDFSESS